MTTPKLTIHTHTDLIEVLPLFAGYQPTDSLTVLFINGNGAADKAARIDLSLNPVHLAHIMATIAQQAAHLHTDRGPGSVHAVAYSDDTHTADHTLLFLADNWPHPNTTTSGAGPILGMLASASSTSWATVDPTDPTKPTSRHPYPAGTSVIAAQAAYAGAIREHDSRDQLAATLAAPDQHTAAAFADRINAIQATPVSDAEAADQVQQWMTDWISNGYPTIDDQQTAELAAAVQHLDARDTAWVHISAADARHHLNLWRHIARHIDGPHSLPVLGLAAAAAWIDGNGTLVNIALDRAHTIPEAHTYTLLGLLEQIITAGLPPTAWTQIRADLAHELRNRS